MENKLSERIKSFSFHIMFFQSHYGSFWLRVWRILYFCDNEGPLSNVSFSALYFYNSLLNYRLKSKEMTACFQNFRFYRSIILNYSSEVKCKLITNLSKNIIFTFLLMTYVEKTSYFEVAPPGHTIAYKNVDNLLKNGKFKF